MKWRQSFFKYDLKLLLLITHFILFYLFEVQNLLIFWFTKHEVSLPYFYRRRQHLFILFKYSTDYGRILMAYTIDLKGRNEEFTN